MVAPLHTCKNCGHSFNGKYCNQCGEKVRYEKDKSVPHLLDEGLHFVTHFEGTFFNTLKAIVTKPGQLSLDYCSGRRKKYFKPLSFFLLLVMLYLLFPVFEGLNMKLYYHVRHSFYGEYAMQKTKAVMLTKSLSDSQIAERFHQKGEKTSKFLLFLIIPVTAFFSWLLGFRKRKFYFDHFVFSIEAASFFILWGFLLLPFLMKFLGWIGFGRVLTSEAETALASLSVFFLFLVIAARRFFRFRSWYSILYSLLFTAALVLFIEFIYKFILFLIAIHLIG